MPVAIWKVVWLSKLRESLLSYGQNPRIVSCVTDLRTAYKIKGDWRSRRRPSFY